MLNRANEINIIRSYVGIYDLHRANTFSHIHEDNNRYIHYDEKLRLKIISRESKGCKEFRLTTQDSISALFYGELYNFDELIKMLNWKDGDKRTLSFSHLCCLLYQKYGFSFAKYINGMFSLILRDQKEDVFLLVVDRFGLARPVYYNISGKLTFSSHLKLLLREEGLPHEIDTGSLALFLKYSYVPSPRSIIKGISKLNPGEMIIVRGDTCKIDRYIDFEIKTEKINEEDAVEEYARLLTEAVSIRLEARGHQQMGVFLSGGLDSSANVAVAAQLDKCKFETFGVGFDNPDIDERPYARIVAEHFGIPFNDYVFNGSEIEDLPQMLWNLEEPFLENGLFLTYAGFKSIKNRAEIIISGNCADQLFGTGGFAGGKPIALRFLLKKLHILSILNQAGKITRSPIFYKDNNLFKLNVLLRRGTNFNDWFFWGFDYNELKQLCKFDISLESLNIFPDNLIDVPRNFADYYQHSVVHQDVEHYACQNVLVKSYRIADMFGVYGRDPYLDYNVVDFLLSLELQLKRKGDLFDYFRSKTKTKYLHRQAMKKILPDSILNKPKQGGFVNMALFLNNPQKRKMIFKYILNSDILKEYLNIKNVEKLLIEYEVLNTAKINWVDHRDSMANKVLYLLTLSLWQDIFLNSSGDNIKNYKLREILSMHC